MLRSRLGGLSWREKDLLSTPNPELWKLWVFGLWKGQPSWIRPPSQRCGDHIKLQTSLHVEPVCLQVESFHLLLFSSVNCSIDIVLRFLQERFSAELTVNLFTLKVYEAAMSVSYALLEGLSVGKYQLVIRFLRGTRRLKPMSSTRVPTWDLSVVLEGLFRASLYHWKAVDL